MSEENEAKRIGARLQKNSGRGWIEKGDARLGPFLIDIKEFTRSFGISIPVWRKVCADAIRTDNSTPALNVILGKGNEKVRLWVIDERMFMEMYDAWRELNE